MKVQIIIFIVNLHLFAWTSSNTGILYEMDDLCALSDSISYNSGSDLYDITCNITILQNDTLKLNPGETVKFYQTGIDIYGTIKALGEFDNKIMIGDPKHTLDDLGERVDGITFHNTSHIGESTLQHCILNGVQKDPGFGGIICEDSSPVIDHCDMKNVPMHSVETGGVIGVFCKGESYPMFLNCNFSNMMKGIAIRCGADYINQDTLNYPSPLILNCNFYLSVTSHYFPPINYDIIIINGGFLDNCYIESDYTLGSPQDSVGDGICTTNSTNNYLRYWLVDGVNNPSSVPVSSINIEDDILPTTSKSLVLNKNYPNPFNPTTTIEYSIIKNNLKASLFIYDCKGNLVKKIFDGKLHSLGNYSVKWNGKNNRHQSVTGGVYFLKLFSDEEVIIKQTILVK